MKMVECPFCGSKMDRNAEETKAYAAASEKEIETVTEHTEDLKLAEKDIQDQIDVLEEKIKQLNEENDTFIHQINQQLQPRAQELLRALNSYKRIVEIKKELSAIEVLSFGLGADALEKEAQDDGESPMYDPNPYLISFVVVFGDTGMEFPDTYAAVEKEMQACEENETPFFVASSHFDPHESWKIFGPPARVLRWCCSVHKSTPQTLKLREITGKNDYVGMDFVGVRKHESVARSEYQYENYGRKQKGQYSFNAILEWTSAEVRRQ